MKKNMLIVGLLMVSGLRAIGPQVPSAIVDKKVGKEKNPFTYKKGASHPYCYSNGMCCKQRLEIKFPNYMGECNALEKEFSFLKADENWRKLRDILKQKSYKVSKKMYQRTLGDAVKIPAYFMLIMQNPENHKKLVPDGDKASNNWTKFFDRVSATVSLDCTRLMGPKTPPAIPVSEELSPNDSSYRMYRGHGPVLRQVFKPLTSAQKKEFEKEKKAAQERYNKEVAAVEKVAIIFPNYTDQCAVLEKDLPFLASDNNWKKVKNFLLPLARKEYHRNLTDRGMLINLMIAITNGNEKRERLVNKLPQWGSFWWEILRSNTELVYSSEGISTQLD